MSDRTWPLEIIQMCPGRPGQDQGSGVLSPSPGWPLGTTAIEPHRRSPPWARMESGSDSRTQRDQLPPTPRSRRSQTSAHPRPSLPRGEAELLQEPEGRKAGLAGWRSRGLRSAGEATTLIGRFLKSVARACQSRARALHFASQESKGIGDRAQTGGRKTRQGARVHVPVCTWMRVCAPARV